ncbi:hypothetical protein chiPu_0029833, partial [Chiloscyllium punctatum]|nr:hypothetical protein [Chiloscyllium punctatum]
MGGVSERIPGQAIRWERCPSVQAMMSAEPLTRISGRLLPVRREWPDSARDHRR